MTCESHVRLVNSEFDFAFNFGGNWEGISNLNFGFFSDYYLKNKPNVHSNLKILLTHIFAVTADINWR